MSGIAKELSSRMFPGGIGNSSFHTDILGGGKRLIAVSMIISFRPNLATKISYVPFNPTFQVLGGLFDFSLARLSLSFCCFHN